MRGKPAPKRIIAPDARYSDLEVSKLINYIMQGGKKATAQRIVYDSFEIVKEKTAQDPLHTFNKAMKMVAPLLEVRSRRVGGANYQIPYQVRGERRFMLACRWMIKMLLVNMNTTLYVMTISVLHFT
jgi:small subunit ribosomal protein S7